MKFRISEGKPRSQKLVGTHNADLWMPRRCGIEQSLLSAKRFVVLVLLALMALSCQEREPASSFEQRSCALFEKTKGALVTVYTKWASSSDGSESFGHGVGFFVSTEGTILTVSRIVPENQVWVMYNSDDGLSHYARTEIVKRDRVLDLAVLHPAEPIRTAGFLQVDLKNAPVPGQSAVVLAVLPHGKEYPVPALLHATVSAVFPGGVFATDTYATIGTVGSPVVDLSTERVIGVCIGKEREVQAMRHGSASLGLLDGTKVSVPALSLVCNYLVARSVSSARDFLSDLP